MRFHVHRLTLALCLLVAYFAAMQRPASAQIRVGTPPPNANASVHPDGTIMTSITLNLCVDGSSLYPCPNPITSDQTYIPTIVLDYGQNLDGVVVTTPPGINSGTISIYRSTDPTPICVLQLAVPGDTVCPPNSTIFDYGTYVLSASLTFPPGSPYIGSSTNASICGDSTVCNVSVTVNLDPTTIILTSSANPATLGSQVTFTAAVQGMYPATPTGQVVFSFDGVDQPPSLLDSTGTATFSTFTLSLGQHTIAASYAGALDFEPATTVHITQQITPPATLTTIASSLNPSAEGQSVTFTATVAPTAGSTSTPTGKVAFFDGTTIFATEPLIPKGSNQMIAQASTTSLTVGTHNIHGDYSGDIFNAPSASPALVQQVTNPLPSGYTITVTPSPVSVGVGLTAVLTVTVTPTGGYSNSVALDCSNLPTETACTFGEAAIPVGGGSTTLELSTMAPHDCGSTIPYFTGTAALHPPSSATQPLRYAAPILAGVFLLLIPRRSRKLARSLFALAGLCAILSLNACSSHCTDFGTIPGNYTFKVNGTTPATTPVTTGTTPSSPAINVSTSVALSVKL